MMTRASERATGGLRRAILAGELPAGRRLGEVALAERLGVSRTPVREALSRLAAEGLVELTPRRGARVASFSAEELESIFAVRAALEPLGAARAAERATPADVEGLQALAEEMLAVGHPGPGQHLETLVGLNQAFHGQLLEIANQPPLTLALAGVMHAPVVLRNFHAYDPDSLRRSLGHHEELVAAIGAADAQWASAVMVSHVANARVAMVARRSENKLDHWEAR